MGEPYGELPTPLYDDMSLFMYWYYEKNGVVNMIDEDTIVTLTEDHTLIAYSDSGMTPDL